MKTYSRKSIIPIIGVAIILLAVLSRRIVAKNLNLESLISFLVGFTVVVVGYIIFKKLMNNRGQ